MSAPTFLQASDVTRLLPMDVCIEAVEDAFRGLARGEAFQPLRTVVEGAAGSALFVMPGRLGRPGVLGAKLLTLFPGNDAQGRPSHQGVVVLFDPDDGTPSAVIDAGPITALRTAAASAVATRLLAREDACDLAILGSGVQARSHLEAMRVVRPIRRVRAWSPTEAHLEAFVTDAREAHDIPVEKAAGPRDAVEGANLVCLVTSSPVPVVESGWIRPGTHVNAVGAHTAATRELDTDTVVRSRFYVDSRESALAEAGELLVPIAEGAIDATHIAGEIGEVLEGRAEGRRAPDEITIFKSLGLAVQDLSAAARALAASSA